MTNYRRIFWKLAADNGLKKYKQTWLVTDIKTMKTYPCFVWGIGYWNNKWRNKQ
jgi:hypothetical protein